MESGGAGMGWVKGARSVGRGDLHSRCQRLESRLMLYGKFLLSCECGLLVSISLSKSSATRRTIYGNNAANGKVKVPLAVSGTLYRTLCRDPYCRRPDKAISEGNGVPKLRPIGGDSAAQAADRPRLAGSGVSWSRPRVSSKRPFVVTPEVIWSSAA